MSLPHSEPEQPTGLWWYESDMKRKVAFLFPGQGTIPEGPLALSPRTERMLRLAAEAGLKIQDWLRESDPCLALTENAQPVILIDSLGKEAELRKAGISPDFVAGHSLGEYAALVSSGVITPEEALSVVVERGRLMGSVPGGMAAILKLSGKDVEDICAATGATVANYNAPGQIVISGRDNAIEKAMALAKERGGRAIKLNVSGPFHSPLMAQAQEALSPRIEELEFRAPQVPVVSGVSGKVELSPVRLKKLLLTQITACVLWEAVIDALVNMGVRTAIEVGPGDVLTRIGRRITDRVEFMSYEEAYGGRT